MTVEGFIELRPDGGRSERVFATAGGAPVPVLDGTVEVRLLPAGEGGVVSESEGDGSELLAARLEIIRLRAAAREARGHVRVFVDSAACMKATGALEAALSAPAPPLAELRELVKQARVVVAILNSGGTVRRASEAVPVGIEVALDAALEVHPYLAKD